MTRAGYVSVHYHPSIINLETTLLSKKFNSISLHFSPLPAAVPLSRKKRTPDMNMVAWCGQASGVKSNHHLRQFSCSHHGCFCGTSHTQASSTTIISLQLTVPVSFGHDQQAVGIRRYRLGRYVHQDHPPLGGAVLLTSHIDNSSVVRHC